LKCIVASNKSEVEGGTKEKGRGEQRRWKEGEGGWWWGRVLEWVVLELRFEFYVLRFRTVEFIGDMGYVVLHMFKTRTWYWYWRVV
jgi:hypothetical protein